MTGKGWRRIGRLPVAGKTAKKVWLCDKCSTWHSDKPAQCIGCGHMVFMFFPSEGEAKHWARLNLQLRAGDISDLRRQVPLDLMTVGPTGLPRKWGELIVDYAFKQDGVQKYLDWKPVEGPTPETVLKVRCLEAQGIIVEFITKRGMV